MQKGEDGGGSRMYTNVGWRRDGIFLEKEFCSELTLGLGRLAPRAHKAGAPRSSRAPAHYYPALSIHPRWSTASQSGTCKFWQCRISRAGESLTQGRPSPSTYSIFGAQNARANPCLTMISRRGKGATVCEPMRYEAASLILRHEHTGSMQEREHRVNARASDIHEQS